MNKVRIYSFLGLAGEVFSRGLYPLTEKLEDEFDGLGTVHNWPEWKGVLSRIKSKEEEDIVLIGHSLGARVAVKLCNELVKIGRPPRAVVLLDYVHNLVGMNDLKADKEVPTLHLMSKDIRVRKLKNALNKSYRGLNHTEIDDDVSLIHKTIIDYVRDNL